MEDKVSIERANKNITKEANNSSSGNKKAKANLFEVVRKAEKITPEYQAMVKEKKIFELSGKNVFSAESLYAIKCKKQNDFYNHQKKGLPMYADKSCTISLVSLKPPRVHEYFIFDRYEVRPGKL